ncbi:MAG: hypothetical protein Q8Q90_02625 [bacterium]|nr:hypothetical protein [bacterium]
MNPERMGFDPEKEFINPWDLENKPNAEQGAERKGSVETSHRNMETMIGELAAMSRFEKVKNEVGEEVLKSRESGEEFSTKRLTSGSDPLARDVWNMMRDEFKDEADTLSWVRESIRQKLNNYDVVIAPDGQLASFSNTRYLELDKGEPKQAGKDTESILFVSYILTADNARGKGLATELYKDFYKDTLEKAKESGHAIKAIFGESVESVEPFLNKMGRKRLYFEDAEGNVREVPYKAPPCDYDDDTGEPLVDGAKEHIMIRLIDNAQEMDSGELMRMVKALYYQEYTASPEDYNNKNAWQRSKEVIDGYLAELESALFQAKDGRVFLMSATERKQKVKELNKEGKEIYEIEKTEEDKE